MESWGIYLAEIGYLPDALTRIGIRQRLAGVLNEQKKNSNEEELVAKMKYIQNLKTKSTIAIHTSTANKQHYEVPTEFFQLIMGKYLKYSCCWFDSNTKTLDEAEVNMLNKYCESAELKDGMDLFDLGCGWGSFALFAAAKYPNSRITALSNSSTQREFIEKTAQQRGLTNIQVITNDINDFQTTKTFDRIISIEMFEHMKNYELLLKRINSWLKPDGKLFVHIFSHIKYAYDFKEGDWMADNFFSGGTMPSDDLLLYFQKDLHCINHWRVSGVHYQKTSEAWLQNMDKPENKNKIREIFKQTYGHAEVDKWINMWRLFFLAVAELFAYENGQQWLVSHYLFQKHS